MGIVPDSQQHDTNRQNRAKSPNIRCEGKMEEVDRQYSGLEKCRLKLVVIRIMLDVSICGRSPEAGSGVFAVFVATRRRQEGHSHPSLNHLK